MRKAYEAMADFTGISSHHDTITGTSRTRPVADTFKRMHRAQQTALPVYARQLIELVG